MGGGRKNRKKNHGELKSKVNPSLVTPAPDQTLILETDVEANKQLLLEHIAVAVPYDSPEPPDTYPCFGCNVPHSNSMSFPEAFNYRCRSCGIPVCNQTCEENPAHKNYECDLIANQIKMKESRTDLKILIADVTVVRFARNVHHEFKGYQDAFFQLLKSNVVIEYRKSREFEDFKANPRKFFRLSIKLLKDIELVLNIHSIIRPNVHSFTFEVSYTVKLIKVTIFSLVLANVKSKRAGNLELEFLSDPHFQEHQFKSAYSMKLALKSKGIMAKGAVGTIRMCKCLSCCVRHPELLPNLTSDKPILLARRSKPTNAFPNHPITLNIPKNPKPSTSTNPYYEKFGFEGIDDEPPVRPVVLSLPISMEEFKPRLSVYFEETIPNATVNKPRNYSYASRVILPTKKKSQTVQLETTNLTTKPRDTKPTPPKH